MFNRRRIALVVAGASLLLASGAAAAESDQFSATSTPSQVRPSTPAVYTVTLTNNSPDREADQAKIGVATDFAFGALLSASTSTAGACVQSTWVADGELFSGGKINLTRPPGNPNEHEDRLCPGATLTVVFSATSAAAPGSYSWAPELLRDQDPFTLTTPKPTVQVDATEPDTVIDSGPPTPTKETSASFSFSADEPGSTFECSLDGEGFAACPTTQSYSGLPEGLRTFKVRAKDLAGNIDSTPATHSWTIETRAPTASVTSRPAALSNSRSATFAFSADEHSTFECQLDGGSFQVCGSPASYQGLGDGTHTFAVRPTDAAGNIGATSSHGWRIDGTAPETTLGSGPRSGTTALSANFTFSASEPAAFECKLDSAAFAPCTSPKSHAGLARREHTFEVRAIDAAGNPDPTPAIHRWTIAAAPRRAATTSALLAPRAGARVTSPPLLVWRRAARASYYNVQLYRGRVKVLSSWPVRTRLQLRARWTYLGRQRQLAPGAYRWYVWPGYGRPSARRYGRLLGQSTFTVTPRR